MAPVKYVGSNKQSTKNTATHSRTLGGDSRTRLPLVPSLAYMSNEEQSLLRSKDAAKYYLC